MFLSLFANKKIRFAATSALMTAALVFLSSAPYISTINWTLLMPLLALFLTYFALGRPGGIEVITLLLLPVAVSFGAGLGQYFFPNFQAALKVFLWGSFFASFYLLLLALNVFRVERLKGDKIPLERAARPASFILSFLAAFLLFTAVYKLELGVLLTAALIFGLGFLLSLNLFWFFSLTDFFEKKQFAGALVVGLGIAQISLAFSFFPWEAHLRGLSEGVFFYAILGVARAYFEKHLKYSIVLEYILLSLAVFLLVRFF